MRNRGAYNILIGMFFSNMYSNIWIVNAILNSTFLLCSFSYFIVDNALKVLNIREFKCSTFILFFSNSLFLAVLRTFFMLGASNIIFSVFFNNITFVCCKYTRSVICKCITNFFWDISNSFFYMPRIMRC